jgi:hypothetical protein
VAEEKHRARTKQIYSNPINAKRPAPRTATTPVSLPSNAGAAPPELVLAAAEAVPVLVEEVDDVVLVVLGALEVVERPMLAMEVSVLRMPEEVGEPPRAPELMLPAAPPALHL